VGGRQNKNVIDGDLVVSGTVHAAGVNSADMSRVVSKTAATESTVTTVQANLASVTATANTAASDAESAEASAAIANALLADIASDFKLTPVEKIVVRREWDVIAAERIAVHTQAETFGFIGAGSLQETYDNAAQALANYLNGGSTWVWL
jgi:hypothetical protein